LFGGDLLDLEKRLSQGGRGRGSGASLCGTGRSTNFEAGCVSGAGESDFLGSSSDHLRKRLRFHDGPRSGRNCRTDMRWSRIASVIVIVRKRRSFGTDDLAGRHGDVTTGGV